MKKKKKELNIYLLDKNRRRPSFKIRRFLSKILIRKPKYKFTGEEFPDEPIVLLSNHVGKRAPSKIELYYPREFRMWGTHEMTEGFSSVHKYLRTTYYHDKRHLPRFMAWIFATIATIFINPLYRGMKIIPTYKDHRFITSLKLSFEAYQNKQDIIIFPEDSSEGYKEQITAFYAGFVSLLKNLFKKGFDVPVFIMYFQKKANTFVVSHKIMFSEIAKKFNTIEEIANEFRIRMNALMNA